MSDALAVCYADRSRVLVVEQDDSVRRLVSAVLTDDGFAVATAASLPDALRSLAEQRPHLLLVDPGLPHDATVQSLSRTAAAAAVPVMAYSAAARTLDDLRGWLDADAYLLKPFNIDVLSDTVRALTRSD